MKKSLKGKTLKLQWSRHKNDSIVIYYIIVIIVYLLLSRVLHIVVVVIRLAVEKLLSETKRNKMRADRQGASGWYLYLLSNSQLPSLSLSLPPSCVGMISHGLRQTRGLPGQS